MKLPALLTNLMTNRTRSTRRLSRTGLIALAWSGAVERSTGGEGVRPAPSGGSKVQSVRLTEFFNKRRQG